MRDSSRSSAGFWDSSAPVIWLLVITIAAFSLIVLLYAGLIPLGYWTDEYATLGEYARDGWSSLSRRLSGWSPRPFSELILFAYAQAVAYFRAPLIEYALGALWLVLGACMLAYPLLLLGEGVSRQLKGQATALALGLLCLSLLAHPVAEIFYWPQAAIAYFPVIAVLSMTVWGLVLGRASRRIRYGLSAALCVAALSAEVGAIFVAVFCTLVVLYVRLDGSFRGGAEREDRSLSFLILPSFCALGVLVAILLGRFESADEIFGDANVAHHLTPALILSGKRYLLETLSLSGIAFEPRHLLAGTIAKALFLLGAYGTLSPIVATRRITRFDQQLVALAGLACFVAMFLILASAYYQFGSVCCERHGTFRQLLLFFGLLSFAAWFAGRRTAPAGGHPGNYATAGSLVMLGVSVAIPALYSIRSIAGDYRDYSFHREVQATNWESGLATGRHFDYTIPPLGNVHGGLRLPDGTHTITDDSGWMIHSILTYFQKDSVTFKNVTNNDARE